MADTIDLELAELVEEFEFLGDWEERYRHLIDLGRQLAPLTDAERSDENKVRGCASQVWLVRDPDQAGRLFWRGDSDAHIVRGLIAVVLKLYNGHTAADAGGFDAAAGLSALGLNEALSTQRSNGLKAMLARIAADAKAG